MRKLRQKFRIPIQQGSDSQSALVNAELVFNEDRPIMVTLIFNVGGERIPWVFSRELLAEGVNLPAGLFDVQVWPEGQNDVVIQLSNVGQDSESARCRLPRAEVEKFLTQTFALVPRESEELYFDTDAFIRSCFTSKYVQRNLPWLAISESSELVDDDDDDFEDRDEDEYMSWRDDDNDEDGGYSY